MEIDKKIEAVQSRLTRILIENDLDNSAVIAKLESLGLDIDTVTNLIESYKNAESAKNIAKGAWETALDSRVESDSTANIAKSQQQESEARQQFDKATFNCALLIVAKAQDPNQINEEILLKLYENGILEEQIKKTALKITYHYYCESMEKDKDRKEKDEKVIEYSAKVKSGLKLLEQEIKDLKSQIKGLESQNEMLNNAYKKLQDKFSSRIKEDEESYQKALSLIKELKGMINQLQNRGIFQTIGDKILGRNVTRRLPRGTAELPESLYESKAKKVGMTEIDKDILTITSKQTQPSSDNRTDKKDEWQQ